MLHLSQPPRIIQALPWMIHGVFMFAVVVVVADHACHNHLVCPVDLVGAAVLSNHAAWGHYREYLVGRQSSPVTIREYRHTLLDLFAFLETRKVTGPDGTKVPRQWHQVRPRDYHAWLGRPLARNSQNTYSKRVLHFYDLAAKKRWLPGRNPLADVEPVRPAARKPRALPLSKVGELLVALADDQRLHMMACICYWQGLRIGEVCRLSVEDLDWTADPPTMWIRGKGGQDESMDISPGLIPGLRAYLLTRPSTGPLIPNHQRPGAHLDPNYAACLLARRMRPIVGDSAHALRHTHATELLEATDENIRKVQLALRHKSIKSTEGYVKTRPGRLVGWLALLPDPLQGPASSRP